MADLVIRGMEMPNNVFDCPLNSFGICNLSQDETHCDCIGDSRPEWCPLVPLPEGHGRLVDLDKLDYAFTALRFNEDGSLKHWDDRKNWCLHGSEIETLLANAPTIVPAEGGGEE